MNRAVPATWILYGLGISQLGDNDNELYYGGAYRTARAVRRPLQVVSWALVLFTPSLWGTPHTVHVCAKVSCDRVTRHVVHSHPLTLPILAFRFGPYMCALQTHFTILHHWLRLRSLILFSPLSVLVRAGQKTTVSQFMSARFGYQYYMRWWVAAAGYRFGSRTMGGGSRCPCPHAAARAPHGRLVHGSRPQVGSVRTRTYISPRPVMQCSVERLPYMHSTCLIA